MASALAERTLGSENIGMNPRLSTPHGDIPLPSFFPDATRAVVRSIDAQDLAMAGIEGIYVNALHLAHEPGLSVIDAARGVHRFMGWTGPAISDSGGYQVYSLIERSKSYGSITDEGFTYRLKPGDKKSLLTPEKCIENQFRLGTDAIICLDQCTHPKASPALQRESVDHTVAWARRSRTAYDRCAADPAFGGRRPLLFAVVQGGADPALRRRCAEGLLEAGFDGYGYGGWPVERDGSLVDMVEYTAGLLPRDKPLLALGIGGPLNILAARGFGYTMFDCTLPTRDARHERLYVFQGEPGPSSRDWHGYVQIGEEQYVRDQGPVEAGCDCACCRGYTRAYLHHLFAIEDVLAWRLATIHNLRFYARLFAKLRGA